MKNNSESFHLKHEHYTELLYDKEELPHRYVFVLTNQCNMRCPFCYQKKGKNDSLLDKSDWFSILDQLPEYARITLTGGEPLIHPDFKEIFCNVAQKFQCNIITNGTLLNKDIIDYILSFENFSVLSISIDSVHKKIRPLTKSQIVNLEKNVKYFINKRNETGSHAILDIKTLILEENLDELLDIHLYCSEKIKCDHHTYQFLKGSSIQHSDIMFSYSDLYRSDDLIQYHDMEEIKRQLKKIQEMRMSCRAKTFLHPTLASLMDNDDLVVLNKIENGKDWKANFYPCKYPWSSIHVNYDGIVFPCLSIPVGNIKEQSLVSIIKSEEFRKFKQLLRQEKLFEACYRCGWLKVIRV